MRTLSFPYSPVILATFIGFATFAPVFADEPEVVDPTTGEIVAISVIDFDALSEGDRINIGDQLAEQGITLRGRGRVDLSEIEVVVPTTGETVSLADIDRSSLSEEDRQDIGDQLADQGLSIGRPGRHGDADNSDDADTEIAASEDGDNGRGGRGGSRY
ncbi:hypothetical protein [uncultured Roseobacter sp.]|uniref:hypothetical protein n=1 Tax=uncultured Roseobacter sp. TaxID=114847 RepID=UPI00260873A0|nr:hypothetical protein [uncultured Roseobacter sp.]